MQDLINRNSSRLNLCMRLMDVMALQIAGIIAAQTHFRAPLIQVAPIHTVLLYFCCGLAFLLFREVEVYESRRGRSMADMLLRLAGAWSMVLFIGVVFSFLIHQTTSLSRMWLCYWFVLGLSSLMCFRAVAYSALSYLRRKGLNSKRVLIVGYGAIGREMHRRAKVQDWYGYEIKAVQDSSETSQALDDASITRLAKLADIPHYVAAQGIHEIWITLPMSESARLSELQFLLRNVLVDIRWMPDTQSMHILSNRMGDFLGFPAVELNRPLSRDVQGLVKDCFDKLFALAVLVALSPLFCVIAACIKYSSPGPVFFRQPRLGLNGKPFNVFKFRSMHLHRDSGVTQATRGDARTFPIGQIIRRTSLDELPQFFNVLRGEMSVVGPRPHALQHNELYKDLLDSYMLRHRVKPGITGWAQIHGYRGETDTVDKMASRVKFDLHYIQHWSLWLDLHIIFWTALKGWTGKNVY